MTDFETPTGRLLFTALKVNTLNMLWELFDNCELSGPHTLSHSLSWSNSRTEIRNGVAYTKLWTPDDPRTAKAAGYYPSESWPPYLHHVKPVRINKCYLRPLAFISGDGRTKENNWELRQMRRWEHRGLFTVCVEIMEQINFSLTLHAPVIPLSPLNGQTNVLRWLVMWPHLFSSCVSYCLVRDSPTVVFLVLPPSTIHVCVEISLVVIKHWFCHHQVWTVGRRRGRNFNMKSLAPLIL